MLKYISSLQNEELPIHFRVCRKSATIAQTDGRLTTEGPLYTGNNECRGLLDLYENSA